VVTLSITAEAFKAIAATLPKGSKADARPDGKGGYLITLPRSVIDRLKAMRGPGESYSDVIVRLAKGMRAVQKPPFYFELQGKTNSVVRPLALVK
jgi:hypothetical protein